MDKYLLVTDDLHYLGHRFVLFYQPIYLLCIVSLSTIVSI